MQTAHSPLDRLHNTGSLFIVLPAAFFTNAKKTGKPLDPILTKPIYIGDVIDFIGRQNSPRQVDSA